MVGFTRRTVVLLAAGLLLASCAVDRAGRRRSALGALSPPIRPTARLYPPETAETRRIRAAIEKPVSVDFQATPFDKVMDTFADLAGVNIVVDQKALAVENIGADTLIKLKVKNIPLASALDLAIRQVNLDYVIWDEMLFVTNREGLGWHDVETRVYDVRDLVGWLEDRPAPKDDGNRSDRPSHRLRWPQNWAGNWNSVGEADNAWEDDDESWRARTAEEETTAVRPIDEIALLIQGVVWPGSWGAWAWIQTFRDESLIIKTTPRVQGDIEVLLTRLRDLIARQAVPSDRKRVHTVDLRPPDTPEIKRLREQLAKPVSVEFPSTPFEEALESLCNVAGLNIVLDINAARTENIGPETKIRLKIENVPAERVLNLILQQVNLDYMFEHDVIYITNQLGIAKDVWVRVYAVRDLVTPDEGEDVTAFRSHAAELADFIKRVIVPDSCWRTGGLGLESIEVLGGEVFIIGTDRPGVHNDTWALLNTLCEALSPAGPGAVKEAPWARRLPPLPPEKESIHRALARRVTLDFPGTRFDQVIMFLENLTGVKIVLDEDVQKTEGVGPETPIRLKVTNVGLVSALDLILEQVSLEYFVQYDRIFLTKRERLKWDVEVRLYDVADLVQRPVRDISRRAIEDRPDTTANREADRVVGGWGAGEEEVDALADIPAPLRDLAALIVREAGPHDWNEYSGIASFRNRIIAVTAPALAQERIAALLTRLRAWLRE